MTNIFKRIKQFNPEWFGNLIPANSSTAKKEFDWDNPKHVEAYIKVQEVLNEYLEAKMR